MLKIDQYRIQFLTHLRQASRPVEPKAARAAGNVGVRLSYDYQLIAQNEMEKAGWIKRTPRRQIFITTEGRIAVSKMKKIYVQ
jgi:hypothetical protein